jgi:hypothetical protein
VEERSITNHRESLRRLSQKYGSKTPCFIPCPWPRPGNSALGQPPQTPPS